MNENTEPVVLALTGQMPFVVIVSSIAAFVISLSALWFYRRAVLKAMSRCIGTGKFPNVSAATDRSIKHTEDLGELSLLVSGTDAEFSSPGNSILKRAHRFTRRNALIYTMAGVVFTLIITVAVLWSSGITILSIRFLMVFWVYGWPVVLTLGFLAAYSRRELLQMYGGYFAGLVLLSVWALTRSINLTLEQIVLLWAITNLPPTFLMYAFLARPIRAVGPLVLVLMLTSITGAVLALALVDSNESLLRIIVGFTFEVGLNALITFFAILMIGFLLFGMLGWFLLGFIRRGYLSKRLNDESIMLDAIWLLFAVFASMGLAFEGIWWTLSGIVAFISFKLVVNTGFRFATHSPQVSTTSAQLLLLRVFSLGKRSENLFDPITKLWRYIGNVNLIAGPDLVTTTVEPHEFLSFVSGGLNRLFISGADDMQQRMSDLDEVADFDGRFRIHDFFCYADTWKLALTSLVKRCDVVLMDLRGLCPKNNGCVYELNELINAAPLQQVVLVIDNTTDYSFLENTLKQMWQDIRADSPNISLSVAKINIIDLTGSSSHSITQVLSQLTEAVVQKSRPREIAR